MTLTEARRRLIIKAALQWARQDGSAQLCKIKMDAYGQVAADVLDMCMTPSQFDLAIRDALSICPLPYLAAGTRERTAEKRAAWQAEITKIVLWLLGDVQRRVSGYKRAARESEHRDEGQRPRSRHALPGVHER